MINNILIRIILKLAKILFSGRNEIGYEKGDAILLFYSGNIPYKHASEIRKSLFTNTTKLLDEYNKQSGQYCCCFTMLEYTP